MRETLHLARGAENRAFRSRPPGTARPSILRESHMPCIPPRYSLSDRIRQEDIMSRSRSLSRRSVLASAAALPLAAATAPAARAAAPMMGVGMTRFNRVTLGDFEVTTLLAATAPRPDPHSIFGLNVSAGEFDAVSEAANIPADQAQFFFTPTVVNTGDALVLFDTGLDAGGITGALGAAGYSPDQVDHVVVTHMHGDHIGGLMAGDTPTFPNAAYTTASAEYDYWAAAGNDRFDARMRPL